MTGRATANVVLVVAALYALMPALWLVVSATKGVGDLFSRPGFELGSFNLVENLKQLFTIDHGIYGRWLLNSVLYSVVGAFVSAMLSMLAGYAFDKYDFPGKEKLFGLVLLGVLVPATITSLPTFLLFSKIGLVNTYWGVLLPSVVSPFGVYLARVFSEGYVPGEVLEAARVDGAGELKIFGRIALPMLSPGLVTLFLFSFTASWNTFLLPLIMLSDQHLFPVTLGVYSYYTTTAQSPEFYPVVITGSLVAVLPLIVAFISLQRFWRSGLTAGAVK